MQVSTTPCRESDTKTGRPRLDVSVLINELCDIPEIDWELAVVNRSVHDICTGLKLDERQKLTEKLR